MSTRRGTTGATDRGCGRRDSGGYRVVPTVRGVTVVQGWWFHKTQVGSVVTVCMDELGSRPAEGQRVRATVGGRAVHGRVESVTYTPKKGNLIAKVTLDEPGPDGRTALAVAVEDLDGID